MKKMLHLTQTTFQEGLMLKSGGSVVNVVIHGKRRYQIDVLDPVAHNAFQRGETLRKNTHPTVKPTDLMQYLVRLVSPKGATILDPFNGSGSTGKAVMFENKERDANYKYIGIELTDEMDIIPLQA